MKKIILFLIYLSFTKISLAQSLIIGKWVNEYNSVLDIQSYDLATGLFSGEYSSSTGATGRYKISGYSPVNNYKEGSPIVLSVYWKSIDGSNDTPDQQWTSNMTGSFIIDQTGGVTMQVFHSLNVSLPLSQVQLENPGRYSETLHFHPYTEEISSSRHIAGETITYTENKLVGTWPSENEYFENIGVESVGPDGKLSGVVRFKSGATIKLTGFTTVSPTGNLQSVSINYMVQQDGSERITKCYSLSGFLDIQTSSKPKLDLVLASSKSVDFKNNYSGVKISPLSFGEKKSNDIPKSVASISFSMKKLPFTNNGSTDWIALIPVGTANPGSSPRVLKFGMDSGGNFNWVNSTQCKANPCINYGHVQFDPDSSSTFRFVDSIPKIVNWGPWGHAMANLGSDVLGYGSSSPRINMKLITDFSDTPQFQEFLWDGAIAFPSSSLLTLDGVSNFLAELINQKKIELPSDGKIAVSFSYSYAHDTNNGLITISHDKHALYPIDESSKLVFKQESYKAVPYLWTTDMSLFSIGDKVIVKGESASFSFDTGSSALKGDSVNLTIALNYAKSVHESTGKWPDITYEMGTNTNGNTGKLILTSDQYVQFIDQGTDAGTYQPQIQTLTGTPNLYVQGTTLLRYVYSVFWYDVLKTAEKYEVIGKEVWLYNYENGPKIIQTSSKPNVFSQRSEKDHMIIYPNLSSQGNQEFTVNFYSPSKSNISIKISELFNNGALVYEKDYGELPAGSNSLNLNIQNTDNLKEGVYVIHVVSYSLTDSQTTTLTKEKIIIK